VHSSSILYIYVRFLFAMMCAWGMLGLALSHSSIQPVFGIPSRWRRSHFSKRLRWLSTSSGVIPGWMMWNPVPRPRCP
jgi:hypothetical protein